MTVNGVTALILRYFTEFGSFRGTLRKSGRRCRKKFTIAISSPNEFLAEQLLLENTNRKPNAGSRIHRSAWPYVHQKYGQNVLVGE